MLEGTVTNAICLNLKKKEGKKKRWVKGMEGENRKKRCEESRLQISMPIET